MHESVNATDQYSARKGLIIYFAILIAGSTFLESRILHSGKSIDQVPLLIAALMYVPAAASVVARLVLREGFTDVSFRLAGPEGAGTMTLAFLYPIVVGISSYTLAWPTGLASF